MNPQDKPQPTTQCIGRIVPQNNRCYSCKADELNKQCPDYVGLKVYELNVEAPKKIERLPYWDDS